MSIMESKVVFVGAGNMAEAIVSGMIAAEFCDPEKIVMTDVRPDRLAELEKEYGVLTSADNSAVENAEIVVLAVKPQTIEKVLREIAGVLRPETLVISIAAGISSKSIEQLLGGKRRIVRAMPNTPVLVGRGASAVAPGAFADQADVDVAVRILGCAGIAIEVDERDLNAVTALSGSGPAYVFYLIEAMLSAAAEAGLDPETAKRLVLQTVEGSAQLMTDSGEDAATLRARVTSKGGTTEAAVRVLDEAGVKQTVIKAVLAARDRAAELSRPK